MSAPLKAAKEAVDKLFSWTGQPPEQTFSELEELRETVDGCLDALRDDGVEG